MLSFYCIASLLSQDVPQQVPVQLPTIQWKNIPDDSATTTSYQHHRISPHLLCLLLFSLTLHPYHIISLHLLSLPVPLLVTSAQPAVRLTVIASSRASKGR